MLIDGRTKRNQAEFTRVQLELERSTFITHWRELGENILPRRPRFFVTDTNKGDRRNQKIINSTATLAARTLRSGMMGGITSPARAWFKLSTTDDDLDMKGPVKDWLDQVQTRMNAVFLKSNLYNMLPLVYGDLGVFGTAPISIEEDFQSVIRTQNFPVGSYMIAKDFTGRINTFCRTFRLTVRQVVEMFGVVSDTSGKVDWSNVSDFVKDAYERGNYETWVEVCHLISPNVEYDSTKAAAKFKKFQSLYYERGISSSSRSDYMKDSGQLLRESGYDYFPVLCPRWEVTGEDVYGTDCPGMSTLGDIKALQIYEKKKASAIEKMINPPMVGPAQMKGQRNSILPGDITYMPTDAMGKGEFKPAFQLQFDVNHVTQSVQEHEARIKRGFYEDLFLMLADSDRRQITATEIDERKEEKLLALGPVLEQVNQDLLDPLIDITFEIMFKKKLIPPPPKEMQGQPLRVEYLSIMAQAQKAAGLGGVDRFMTSVGQAAQMDPQALTKINFDELINVYGSLTGIPPKVVLSDEQAQATRQQQQQAQAQQQQMQMAAQQAQSAKNLSQADTSKQNALTDLMQRAQAGQLAPGA